MDDEALEVVAAAQAIAKYAGFVVLDRFNPAVVYPLLVLRENLYTDPQTPIQVQPGLYEHRRAHGRFAAVCHHQLLASPTFPWPTRSRAAAGPAGCWWPTPEGMSVLTAWAAGKFDAERIAKAVKSSGIADKINHRKLVIPGHVSVLLGEIEEALPGWKILVGPREAVDIPAYLKVWDAV